jgi:hypothetical protein
VEQVEFLVSLLSEPGEFVVLTGLLLGQCEQQGRVLCCIRVYYVLSMYLF